MTFHIELDERWQQSLESLTRTVREQSPTSPEEVVEHAIFTQINEQMANKKAPVGADTPDRGK